MIRLSITALCALGLLSGCNAPAERATPPVPPEFTAPSALPDPGVAGRWLGVLDAGSRSLRLQIDISLDGYEPTIVLTSLDQAGAQFPMRLVRLDGKQVHFSTPGLALRYDGVLEDGRIVGTFNQGGLTTELVLEPVEAVSTSEEDAAASDPREQGFEVALPDGVLKGTLLIPDTAQASVVLLSGSGPQDRDGMMAGQPVYAALARTLADVGIASLRLDDRGVGESQAPAPLAPADLAADAALALATLREATDLSCAGFVGHSEGGFIALMAAEQAQPDFIISLAGQHQPMEALLYEQSERMIRAAGQGEAAVAANRALQTAVFEAMRSAPPGEARAAIEAALIAAGAPQALAEQQAAIWGQPYAVAMMQTDPDAYAAAYRGPLAALFAERDLQVSAKTMASALREARGDRPTRIDSVEGVDHLFQDSETGLPSDYGAAGHALSPRAMTAIQAMAEESVRTGCAR